MQLNDDGFDGDCIGNFSILLCIIEENKNKNLIRLIFSWTIIKRTTRSALFYYLEMQPSQFYVQKNKSAIK